MKGQFGISVLVAVLVACNSQPAPIVDTVAPVVSSVVVSSQQAIRSIKVDVSDNVGVTKVELYRLLSSGTVAVSGKVHTSNNSSHAFVVAAYNFTLIGTQGRCSYFAKAYDDSGNVATSAAVAFMVGHF